MSLPRFGMLLALAASTVSVSTFAQSSAPAEEEGLGWNEYEVRLEFVQNAKLVAVQSEAFPESPYDVSARIIIQDGKTFSSQCGLEKTCNMSAPFCALWIGKPQESLPIAFEFSRGQAIDLEANVISTSVDYAAGEYPNGKRTERVMFVGFRNLLGRDFSRPWQRGEIISLECENNAKLSQVQSWFDQIFGQNTVKLTATKFRAPR